MNRLLDKIKEILRTSVVAAVKWIVFGIVCGILVGAVASVFGKLIALANKWFSDYPWLIFCMLASGPAIIGWYRLLGVKDPKGTNHVIQNIREGSPLPWKMAPTMFVGTILTHLTGGSAGREGAALQIGGSLGSTIGRGLRLKKEDSSIAILCGMSAAFAALFGTPLAATVLPLEIATVGVMFYSALVPCMLSSLTAHIVASELFGLSEADMTLTDIPGFSVKDSLLMILLAIGCSLVSALFCWIMHQTGKLEKKYIENPYLRAAVSGAVVIALTLALGTRIYNNAGSPVIEQCLTDPGFKVFPLAFLIKMVFTAVTLSGGFQGGEIVPSLFIGATFGNLFAQIFSLPSPLASALGAVAVFCGVTNCPISSLLIAFEMFGFGASSKFLLVIALTYLMSGNFGIWSAQKIRYSKIEPRRIDEKTH